MKIDRVGPYIFKFSIGSRLKVKLSFNYPVNFPDDRCGGRDLTMNQNQDSGVNQSQSDSAN